MPVGSRRRRRSWRPAPEGQAGWAALVDGRDSDALSLFEKTLLAHPDDVLARMGEASLVFERGDDRRALSAYLGCWKRRLVRKRAMAMPPPAPPLSPPR